MKKTRAVAECVLLAFACVFVSAACASDNRPPKSASTSVADTVAPVATPTQRATPTVDLLASYRGRVAPAVLTSLAALGLSPTDDLRTLLDALAWCNAGLIPPEIRSSYYGDIDFAGGQGPIFPVAGLEPVLAKAVTFGGVVSVRAVAMLRVLMNATKWDRWYIVRDIITSGMLSDANLDQDWDGDGSSNADEILAGSNPLNFLETVGGPRSARWLVLINGSNAATNYIPNRLNSLYAYHIAKRNGYDDAHILLMLSDDDAFVHYDPAAQYPDGESGKYLYGDQEFNRVRAGTSEFRNLPVATVYRFYGKDLLTYPTPVVVDASNVVDASHVRSAVESLPVGAQDVLTIMYTGHGNLNSAYLSPQSSLYPTDFDEMVGRLHPGAYLLMYPGSYGEGVVEQLRPTVPAVVAFQNLRDQSIGSSGEWTMTVADGLDGRKPIALATTLTRFRTWTFTGGARIAMCAAVQDHPNDPPVCTPAAEQRQSGTPGNLDLWLNPFVFLPLSHP